MDKISGWQSEEELLIFPITLERRSYIYIELQNGASLKLNAAVQTMNSDVLLAMM